MEKFIKKSLNLFLKKDGKKTILKRIFKWNLKSLFFMSFLFCSFFLYNGMGFSVRRIFSWLFRSEHIEKCKCYSESDKNSLWDVVNFFEQSETEFIIEKDEKGSVMTEN